MTYGKLNEGVIEIAPNYLHFFENGKEIFITNPSNEVLVAHGYKPIKQTNYPDKEGNYRTVYEETETEIIQSWEEAPETVENGVEEELC